MLPANAATISGVHPLLQHTLIFKFVEKANINAQILTNQQSSKKRHARSTTGVQEAQQDVQQRS
jgi:hypothetical protein